MGSDHIANSTKPHKMLQAYVQLAAYVATAATANTSKRAGAHRPKKARNRRKR